ncbi:epoxide hydrolase family protein [Cellulomonas sp. ES6]|uniref:epoxide hydrolase family protein n=1 Tax=Cellulomonas sp. ES6 TaxID=3039384 RepID=UPI0024B72083|nr:epoxide hydrolase family protein [Cellulomonas sp. ES6]WHP17878.1 epoxide hydrolase [Cellulomonas sp. ES6]
MPQGRRWHTGDLAFRVPGPEREDLRGRLERTRLPAQEPGRPWERGIPVDVLGGLVDRWLALDWDAVEARLGRERQLLLTGDGAQLHALWRPARREGALPVLALHGWPYTYAQMVPLADALAGDHGVVAPSLPGYVHSPALREPFSARRVAELFHHMMTDGLGHERYLVYGEDIGAPVADWLAGLYPDHVAGIVASHPSFSAQQRAGVELDEGEQAFLAGTYRPEETGYAHQQGTRPDTLAVGLLDSPAGLLAWIAEKVAAWSDGGTATGLDGIAVDELLTLTSLYWFTRSIGTSFRSYAEPADFDLHPVVTVPAALLVNTHERGYPRSLGDKSYTDIRSFERLGRGGHFTAWENPGAVADAIRSLA